MKKRKLTEISILVATLLLSVAFFWFLESAKKDSQSSSNSPESIPWTLHELNSQYLNGFYSENSFFHEGESDYALLYNHRPKGPIWKVSLRGKLLNAWKVYDPSKEGIHLVEKHGDHYYAIVQVRRLQKLDSNGTSVWIKNMGAHHDLDIDERGNIYVLDLKTRSVRFEDKKFPIFMDDIVILDPDGNEIRRTPLWPFLSPLLDSLRGQEAHDSYHIKKKIDDTFHLNALDLLPFDIEGVGKKNDLLVSVRNLDLIVVLDQNTYEVKWQYGAGELQHQHHAQVLSSGEILVFDNGVYDKQSRVLKIDPKKKEIVWRYEPKDEQFFTRRHGSVEELPNGNVLISLGRKGKLFEVDMNGEIVAFAELKAPGVEEVNPYRLGYTTR